MNGPMRLMTSVSFVPSNARRARWGGAFTSSRLLGVALVLLAACAAAIAAHVGIDVAGDYLLPHDAYDFVPHCSRAVVMFGVVVVGLAIVAHLLGAACDDARGDSTLARALTVLAKGSPVLLVARVVVLTLVVLCAMEWLDVRSSGQHLDDIDDLLGGSAVLGLGVTFACGLVAGLCVRALITWLGASRRVLVAALVAFLRVTRTRPPALGIAFRSIRPAQTCVAAALARRGAKRGPPQGTGPLPALA